MGNARSKIYPIEAVILNPPTYKEDIVNVEIMIKEDDSLERIVLEFPKIARWKRITKMLNKLHENNEEVDSFETEEESIIDYYKRLWIAGKKILVKYKWKLYNTDTKYIQIVKYYLQGLNGVYLTDKLEKKYAGRVAFL